MADNETAARNDAYSQAFGTAAKDFQAVADELNKAAYEAYKLKVKLSLEAMKKRAELAKKVPKFWLTSLTNCGPLSPFVDINDRDALENLTDIWIEYNEEDPRDYEIVFSFKGKNPYFSEKVLKKTLTVQPPAGSEFPKPDPYNLDAPIFLTKTAITWTSDAHNLCKKAPRPDLETMEEFDEFSGMGSFFHFFEQEGVDEGLGEQLLEWWVNAADYAAGLQGEIDESDDEDVDSDDEEDEDDDAKEISLESDEEGPKKKKPKTA